MSNRRGLLILALSVAFFASVAGAAEKRAVLDQFDMEALRELEGLGFDLGSRLKIPLERSGATTRALYDARPASGTNWYRDFAAVLTADLKAVEDGMKGIEDHGHQYKIKGVAKNAVLIGQLELQGEAPRILDSGWFSSPVARFHLVGVINRIDRRDFDRDGEKTCGETRLIYRLAYDIANPKHPEFPVRSSLPVLLNLVYVNPLTDEGCLETARKWIPEGAADAGWLAAGPLRHLTFKQLEVNFQSARFSSGYMRDFGGQAMYNMRIFRPIDGALKPVELENMPDVANLLSSPALKQGLLKFLAEEKNLEALDEGRLVLPNLKDENGRGLLATQAISFATLGHARPANKPFSDVLTENDVAAIDLGKLRFVRSRLGLIERLNNLSCVGCHQAGSTAGFHVVGMGDDQVSGRYNQAAVPFSPHFHADQQRREYYVQALLKGEAPVKFRPHSIYPRQTKLSQWPSLSALAPFKAKVKEHCFVKEGGDFGMGLSCEGQGVSCVETVKFVGAQPGKGEAVQAGPGLVRFGECVAAEGSPQFSAGMACRKGEVVHKGNDRARVLPVTQRKSVPVNFYDFLDVLYNSDSADGDRLYNGPSDAIYPIGGPKKESVRGYKVGEYNCGPPLAGAPLGRLQRECAKTKAEYRLQDFATVLKEGFNGADPAQNERLPKEICAIRGSMAFSKCTDEWDAVACLDRVGSARGVLDTCHPGRSCREDYICQLMPPNFRDAVKNDAVDGNADPGDAMRDDWLKPVFDDEQAPEVVKAKAALAARMKKARVGFCTPTYFVFNMRVDGHPDPSGNLAIPKPAVGKKGNLSDSYRGDYAPGSKASPPKYRGVYVAPKCGDVPAMSKDPNYCK